jgi:hypothetical protein
MYSSLGMFVTDPPLRAGANFNELVHRLLRAAITALPYLQGKYSSRPRLVLPHCSARLSNGGYAWYFA